MQTVRYSIADADILISATQKRKRQTQRDRQTEIETEVGEKAGVKANKSTIRYFYYSAQIGILKHQNQIRDLGQHKGDNIGRKSVLHLSSNS